MLLGRVRWPLLADTLRTRRLLPTLGPRIVELGRGQTNDRFDAIVRDSLNACRRQGAFLQLVSRRVLEALEDAGIRCAALKGPLLSEAIYGDPGRRLSNDIDLLVAADQLSEAVAVVRGLGYMAPIDHVRPDGRPLLHFVLLHERDELPPIELHWRVHWYEENFAESCLLPGSPSTNWRPDERAELVGLLLFYARDGFVDLRLATDIGAWWDAYGHVLPRGALDETVEAYPALERVLTVAAAVSEKAVGLPAAWLWTGRQQLGVRGRIATRLANPHPKTSQSQLYADMGLVDGLLMPRGGFRDFVRRQLLPPSEVLNQQARHAARSRKRSALAHCAGALVRYGLTMARTARPPALRSATSRCTTSRPS